MRQNQKNILVEKGVKVLMYFSLALTFLFTFSIVYTILRKGFPSLNWEMVSSVPQGGYYLGGGGGFLNAIIGSLYIVLASTAIGLVISIPIVFYLNVYLKPDSFWGYIVRLVYDVLFGIPSIVYGAFTFSLMVYLGIRCSLGGGILVETILIIPIFVRGIDEVAKNMPRDILTASFALGATRWESISIVLKQIAPGIATATLLGIGRSIGDAAGVMFTAGFSDSIPTSISHQTATLPLSVFFQLLCPQEEVQNRAYAGAVVLTLIILLLSFLGRLISRRISRFKI